MFYDNLQEICNEKGLHITAIVEECGGNRGSISGWKKGAWPNSRLVANIAVRLNTSTDKLLFGNDSENTTILDNNSSSSSLGFTDDETRQFIEAWKALPFEDKAIIMGEVFKRKEDAEKKKENKDDGGQRLAT